VGGHCISSGGPSKVWGGLNEITWAYREFCDEAVVASNWGEATKKKPDWERGSGPVDLHHTQVLRKEKAQRPRGKGGNEGKGKHVQRGFRPGENLLLFGRAVLFQKGGGPNEEENQDRKRTKKVTLGPYLRMRRQRLRRGGTDNRGNRREKGKTDERGGVFPGLFAALRRARKKGTGKIDGMRRGRCQRLKLKKKTNWKKEEKGELHEKRGKGDHASASESIAGKNAPQKTAIVGKKKPAQGGKI